MNAYLFLVNHVSEPGITSFLSRYLGGTKPPRGLELFFVILAVATMVIGYVAVHSSYLKRIGKSWLEGLVVPQWEIDYNKREWLTIGALFVLFIFFIFVSHFVSVWRLYF